MAVSTLEMWCSVLVFLTPLVCLPLASNDWTTFWVLLILVLLVFGLNGSNSTMFQTLTMLKTRLVMCMFAAVLIELTGLSICEYLVSARVTRPPFRCCLLRPNLATTPVSTLIDSFGPVL